MKNILLRVAVFAITFALAISVIAIIAYWYISKPQPPKPWNSTAITAEFVRLSTNDNKNTFPEFVYVLQNNTDNDFDLNNGSLVINAKLLKENSLSPVTDNEIVIEHSIFIPAHQRTRLLLHLTYELPNEIKGQLKTAKGDSFKNILAAHLNSEAGNLNGFMLFDKYNRYQIDLPKGW